MSENTSKTFPFSSLAGQYYNSNYRFVFSYKGWSEQYGAIDLISRTASQSYTDTVKANITVAYNRTNDLVTVTNNSSYYVVLEIELLAISS